MNNEKIGNSGGFSSKYEHGLDLRHIKQATATHLDAEANQKKAEEAAQTAHNVIAELEQQQHQEKVAEKKDDQNTHYIDFSAGTVESGRINHDETQKDTPEQLSDVELEERSKTATTKLKSMTFGTPEFEETCQQIIDIMAEQNDRYYAPKVSAADAVDKAVSAAKSPEVIPNPIKDSNETENTKLSLRERLKKTKIWKKVVGGFVATALLVGAFGIGAKAVNENNIEEAHADMKVEQKANQTKMHEMANGIQYNYDGLFGDAGGYGYNQEKTGQWDFAPSYVLGNVWQDADGTRQALIDLVEKQPDLNGADYLCGLDDGDLNKIDMTKEHGAKLDTISEWMGSDKEFHDEATDLLKDIFNDPDTIVEFGPLTKWSAAGSYVNAGGVISDTATLNDMNNVKIVGSNTQEDEHTAVIHVKTKAGSELLIKAGSFDENGQFVQEDGCAQLIWTFEAAEKVFASVSSSPNSPTNPDSPINPPGETIEEKDAGNLQRIVNNAPTDGVVDQQGLYTQKTDLPTGYDKGRVEQQAISGGAEADAAQAEANQNEKTTRDDTATENNKIDDYIQRAAEKAAQRGA